jgi:hypothetical protein
VVTSARNRVKSPAPIPFGRQACAPRAATTRPRRHRVPRCAQRPLTNSARRIRQAHRAMLIHQPIRRAVWRCFFGASTSDRSISSIAVLNGSNRGAIRCGVLRAGGIDDSSAWRTVRRCTCAYPPAPGSTIRPPGDHGESPQTAPPLTSPSSLTFVISDPGRPDADHGEMGPVQAVTTIAACREDGAKSDRHNDTPPRRRWSQFKPPSWGANSGCHGEKPGSDGACLYRRR